MSDKYLQGKIAVITGASQGLGLNIAKHYIMNGANLALCARDKKQLEKSVALLMESIEDGQRIYWEATDISNQDEVNSFIHNTLQLFGTVDILINNAGVYGPKGYLETLDWSEWRQTLEINLFGQILLIKAILPTMKKNRSGRIIQISGGGATNPMPFLSAYAVSKSAVIRFMETLSLEVIKYGIFINAIAPGPLNTRLLDEVIIAGPSLVGEEFYNKAIFQKQSGGVSMDLAAELAVFLGGKRSDFITGKLISSIWDNWKEWPDFIDKIQTSDVYTLRRIVGKDRQMDWLDK